MFDIGMIEMFVIVVMAVIVVGPKDLPKLVRSVGQFISKIRSMGKEFQTSIKQMADEVELDEVTRKLNKAMDVPLDDQDVKPDIKAESPVAPSAKDKGEST